MSCASDRRESPFARACRTLTNLYNQCPTRLDLAHRTLDHAVLDAYDWPQVLGDEEILSRLLALHLERAAAQANAPRAASTLAVTSERDKETRHEAKD